VKAHYLGLFSLEIDGQPVSRWRAGTAAGPMVVSPGSHAVDWEQTYLGRAPCADSQRAVTLADVQMMAAGEWLALSAPVRVAVGRMGAWAIDL
jgi:hypothetical protein